MRIRSVHSRRTVPTQRSANEFARGAFGGVLTTAMGGASEHRVEDSGEFHITVAEQEPKPGRALIELHQHVARLLGLKGTTWRIGRSGADTVEQVEPARSYQAGR